MEMEMETVEVVGKPSDRIIKQLTARKFTGLVHVPDRSLSWAGWLDGRPVGFGTTEVEALKRMQDVEKRKSGTR